MRNIRLLCERLFRLVRGYAAKLKSSSILANVTYLAGGTASGQFIVIAATPLLTRLFTPAEFGILAVFASITGIAGSLASLRYELAIPIAESAKESLNLTALSLVISLIMGGGVGLLLYHLWDFTAFHLGIEYLEPYVWLVPLGVVLIGLYQVFSYWRIRDHGYSTIAKTKVWQGGGRAAVQVATGLAGVGAIGLIAGDLAGRSLGTMALARDAVRQHWHSFKTVQFSTMMSLGWRYRRFPLLTGSATLFNNVGIRAPALLFAAAFNPEIAGWFALSQRIIGAPMGLLGQAVAKVYLGRVSELRREQPAGMIQLYMQMSTGLLLVGAVPSLLLALVAPSVFAWGFGDEWRMAGVFTRYMAVMLAVQFVANPLSQTLNVLERQDLQLAWDLVRAILVIGVFLAAMHMQVSSTGVVIMYSAVLGLMYILLWLLARRTLTKFIAQQRV